MAANEDFYSDLRKYQAIVVGSNKNTLNQLRTALKSIGFNIVTQFTSFVEALEAGKNSATTHVLFDLRESDMDTVAFVEEIVEENKKAVLVVITEDPGVDNVFDLIKAGSRGFLVPPPTLESVEAVLVSATKGPPISETILKAEDRNHAFATLILNMLFRTATQMKVAKESGNGYNLVDRYRQALEAAVITSKMFCEHGEDSLRDSIFEECLERAKDRKTRLSELRKNLRTQRQSDTA